MPDDEGFCPEAYHHLVLVDGELAEHCFTADDVLGEAHCWAADEEGNVVVIGTSVKTVTKRGKIKFINTKKLT